MRIITDTGSLMSQTEALALNNTLLPLQVEGMVKITVTDRDANRRVE